MPSKQINNNSFLKRILKFKQFQIIFKLIFIILSPILYLLKNMGEYFIFLSRAFRINKSKISYKSYIVNQMYFIGINSLPIIIVTSFFSGMVAAANAGHQMTGPLSDFLNSSSLIGGIVGQSVLMELAPVISGLVLAGKVGATISSEIGAMVVTEQINALESISIDSVSFLTFPRIIAGTIMFPILIVVADFCGIFGGFVSFTTTLNMDGLLYWEGLKSWKIPAYDAILGFVKAFVFGITITSIACYYGFKTKGGAYGVGRSTALTVVTSCVSLIILNYLLTIILNQIKNLL